jgi:predicted ABC-type transport system involved in lysophospholipase L1 biosynthesis ATPase subunit
VTHDPRAARRCDRVLRLDKGRVADGAVMLEETA